MDNMDKTIDKNITCKHRIDRHGIILHSNNLL